MRCLCYPLFLALPITLAAADTWQVDYPASRLGFSAIQEGKPVAGEFNRYQAQIHFDPDNLDSSHFYVLIDTASVNTGAVDRDDILRSEDFFHSERWPNAEFKTLRIRHRQDNRYLAKAMLRIRDIEREVSFPFVLAVTKQKGKQILQGQGELNINRFEFDMAKGDWADTEVIGATVRVEVNIEAAYKPGTEVTQ